MAEMYGARPVMDDGGGEAEQRGGDEAALFWCGCSYRFKDEHDAGASTPGGSGGGSTAPSAVCSLKHIQDEINAGRIVATTLIEVRSPSADKSQHPDWETLEALCDGYDGFEEALLSELDVSAVEEELERAEKRRQEEEVRAAARRALAEQHTQVRSLPLPLAPAHSPVA